MYLFGKNSYFRKKVIYLSVSFSRKHPMLNIVLARYTVSMTGCRFRTFFFEGKCCSHWERSTPNCIIFSRLQIYKLSLWISFTSLLVNPSYHDPETDWPNTIFFRVLVLFPKQMGMDDLFSVIRVSVSTYVNSGDRWDFDKLQHQISYGKGL